jgi:hypothetical protein
MTIRKSIRVRLFDGLVLLLIVLFTFMATVLYAQTPSTLTDQNSPIELSDPGIRERLQKDWKKRNPKFQNQVLQWYELGDGFYGTYTRSQKNYMVLYDIQGKYVETLCESDWNGNVSTELRSSFAMSPYKGQQVMRYWEVTDTKKRGYYLECKDDKGRISRAWVNDKGDFSITPHKRKPN